MTGLTNITLSQLQILLPAAGFLFMGVVALVFPARVTAQFDLPNLTLAGRNEVRAVYGGFGIAIGLLLLASLFMPGFRSGICLAVSVALAGMAGGACCRRSLMAKWPGIRCSICSSRLQGL